MNILFLSQGDPRDTTFGGAQRTNLIWRALREMGSVYTVFYSREKEEMLTPDICCIRQTVARNKIHEFLFRKWNNLRQRLAILHLGPVRPYPLQQIEDVYPGVKFDIVVSRYCFDLMEMRLWHYPKLFVDFDDHPLEVFDTLKGRYVSPRLKPLSRFIIRQQLRFLEKRMSGGWVSNASQCQMFHDKHLISPLPNISKMPGKEYSASHARKKKLITVGVMDYYPNFTGVDNFLTNVWPEVLRVYPDMEFHVIGKGAPASYTERWSAIKGVFCRGFVEDLDAEYSDSLAAVVPINSGGGTCIKTLESLSHSRVCLSSVFGARGIDARQLQEGMGLYVYKTADEFIHLLDKVVMDDAARTKAEGDGLRYIEAHHSEEHFKQTVIETIKAALHRL